MNDYLLIYQNGDLNWREGKSPEDLQRAMQAWTDWFQAPRGVGSPAEPGGTARPGWRRADEERTGLHTDTSMSEVKELIGGYSVIQAESLEEAARLSEDAPFLQNNPKGQIVGRSRPVHVWRALRRLRRRQLRVLRPPRPRRS